MDYSNAVLFVGDSALERLFELREVGILVVVCLLAFLAIVARFELVHAATSGGDSGEPKTNCPSCGARTTVEPGECDYCGESLGG